MTIDPVTLGKRLRAARESSGITQQEAAVTIGIPRTALVHMEAGNRTVSTLELARLANLYTCPIADFFAEKLPDEEDLLVVLHRILTGLEEHPEVDREIRRCISICREGVALEEILGRMPQSGLPPSYAQPLPTATMQAVEQGNQVAREERKRLGLGSAPIADMAELISSQRIWASGVKFPDEMSGLFLNHPTIGIAILVNYDHPRPRKRFSYAHEYAHALLDREGPVRVTNQEYAKDYIEKRANAFAAAFLMPEAGVNTILEALDKGAPSRQESLVYDVAGDTVYDAERRPKPGSQEITYQDGVILARHFGASYQAAVYRLRSLNFISKRGCEKLLEQETHAQAFIELLPPSHKDDVKSDAEKPDRELITQVTHLSVEAYRREEISKGKLLDLAKKLEVSGRKLVTLAEVSKKSSIVRRR